jgi:hypothetical protein
MALQINIGWKINPETKRLTVTDRTGVYAETTNEGGYGTPNPDRSDIALCFFPRYRPSSSAPQLLNVFPSNSDSPTGTAIDFNGDYDNTQESVFTFDVDKDGWHELNVIALPITGSVNGDIYYDGFSIQEIVNGVPQELEDLTRLLNPVLLSQKNCNELVVIDNQFKLSRVWRDYEDCNQKCCDDGACDKQFNQHWDLFGNLESAYTLFRSNRRTKAQEIIEQLNDEL